MTDEEYEKEIKIVIEFTVKQLNKWFEKMGGIVDREGDEVTISGHYDIRQMATYLVCEVPAALEADAKHGRQEDAESAALDDGGVRGPESDGDSEPSEPEASH